MQSWRDNGMVHLSSPHSVPETVNRLESLLRARGLQIMARIDHSGGAAEVGLHMEPTQLVIFGNPKSGTPAMIAAPTLAIDLPLKALIWQDGDGKVWLSYNSPEYLMQRHSVPDHLMNTLAGAAAIFEAAVQ